MCPRDIARKFVPLLSLHEHSTGEYADSDDDGCDLCEQGALLVGVAWNAQCRTDLERRWTLESIAVRVVEQFPFLG